MKPNVLREILAALEEEYSLDPKGLLDEALSLYLNANPALKVNGAVGLWRKGRVSLAKAAEIVGISVPEFKEVLAARGLIRETEGKGTRTMDKKLKALLP